MGGPDHPLTTLLELLIITGATTLTVHALVGMFRLAFPSKKPKA